MATFFWVTSWVAWWVMLGLKLAAVVTWPWLVVAIPLFVAVPLTLLVGAGVVTVILGLVAANRAAKKIDWNDFLTG